MVEGLNGESEGLFFFENNMGEGLSEKSSHDMDKFHSFKNLIYSLAKHEREPFIAGYLGHVFSISPLRKVFKNIIFIHLTRDLVDNATSLEKVAPKNWVSSRPQSLVNVSNLSRREQIVKQLIGIHEVVLKNYKQDVINIRYKDLCADPKGFLKSVSSKFQKLYGIDLDLKNMDLIPDAFEVKKRNSLEIKDDFEFEQLFKKEIKSLSSKSRDFFNLLLKK